MDLFARPFIIRVILFLFSQSGCLLFSLRISFHLHNSAIVLPVIILAFIGLSIQFVDIEKRPHQTGVSHSLR